MVLCGGARPETLSKVDWLDVAETEILRDRDPVSRKMFEELFSSTSENQVKEHIGRIEALLGPVILRSEELAKERLVELGGVFTESASALQAADDFWTQKIAQAKAAKAERPEA